MKCINFDEQFQRFAAEWMKKNAAKYGNNIDRMEARMPEVYLAWLNRPAQWLDGDAPGTFFAKFDDPAQLVEWMLSYHREGVPVPDPLLERLTTLGNRAEKALLTLLTLESAPQEARLTAISLLTELESQLPLALYIDWIATSESDDERADMAAEALSAMGAGIRDKLYDALPAASANGRLLLVDILAGMPGDPRLLPAAIRLFHECPDQRALIASLLGKIGDEAALPILYAALKEEGLPYLDFREISDAIEALGGETPSPMDFSGDPAYEWMKRQEE